MIAALIYIGFACYHLAWDSLPQEILGVIGYGALAVLGDKYNPIFLILGWSLHVLWDIILHSPSSIAPESYPGLCLGFDLAVALYLIYWVFKNHDADKTQSAFKS